MRRHLIALAVAALAAGATYAAPAFADEARVELRSGVTWPDSEAAKGSIGAAAGYDWNLGGGLFGGVEESVDKTLAHGYQTRFATQGRLGMAVTPRDKLYATGGYAYGKGPDAPTVGAGWEHSMGNKMYGKVEYKKFFNEDGVRNSNAAIVGVGMHF